MMKNIHVLPTDKGTGSLAKSPNTKYYVVSDHNRGISDHIDYNIYITNDDKIKEGDWVFYTLALGFCKTTISTKGLEQEGIPAKKIILTTDGDLIKDGIQAIDDTFLEWFVKNPSCEYVNVQKWASLAECGYSYHIIIPKEEPKQTVEQYEQQGLEKYAYEFQQETLEEAAERFYPIPKGGSMWMPSRDDYNGANKQEGFIAGAKWQQQRMYTLEQISKDFIGEEGQSGYFDDWLDYRLDSKNKLSFREWFEQFKKA